MRSVAFARRGLLALLLAGWLAAPALAQESSEPFATLSLRAGPTANVSDGRLHDFWQRSHGALVAAETPFYAGRVEAGAAWQRFEARSDSLPRFDALFVYLGWRGQWEPARWLRLSAGPRLGSYLMRFPDSEVSDFKRESELMIALNARLGVRLTGRWRAFVAGSYQKLFTAQRIRMGYLTFGFSRTFETPGWLRSVLE